MADAISIPVTLYLDESTKDRLDALCKAEGFTLNGFIRAAIEKRLAREFPVIAAAEAAASIKRSQLP